MNTKIYKMNKLASLLIVITMLFSCEKNEGDKTAEILSNSTSQIVGNYKLTETLLDPGDGSGTFQPVSSNRVISFHTNGTVSSNGNLCFVSSSSNTVSTGTYSMTDSTIQVATCNSLSFHLNGGELIIDYPCIEPCRGKWVKF